MQRLSNNFPILEECCQMHSAFPCVQTLDLHIFWSEDHALVKIYHCILNAVLPLNKHTLCKDSFLSDQSCQYNDFTGLAITGKAGSMCSESGRQTLGTNQTFGLQVLIRQRELGLQQIAGTADMPIDGQPSGQMTVPFAGRGTAHNGLLLTMLCTHSLWCNPCDSLSWPLCADFALTSRHCV